MTYLHNRSFYHIAPLLSGLSLAPQFRLPCHTLAFHHFETPSARVPAGTLCYLPPGPTQNSWCTLCVSSGACLKFVGDVFNGPVALGHSQVTWRHCFEDANTRAHRSDERLR